jgi:glycosidase
LNFYKAMLALRNAMPSLSQGGYASPQTSQNLLAFQRLYSGSPSERSLVVINYGTATASMAVAGLGANAKASSNYPVKGTTLQADATGGLTVGVPGQSVAVYTLTP